MSGAARPRTLAVVAGTATDVGKTFVTLSKDVAVAAGRPWFGHEVKQGTVIYYAFEGGR